VHAVELFIESINTKCPFMAITCDSFESFKKGQCSHCNRDNNFCFRFGFHSISSYKHFFSSGHVQLGYTSTINTFLTTNDKKPFCRAHYKVFVKVAGNDESRMHGGEVGFLFLSLKSEHRHPGSKFDINQVPVYFGPGTNHTFMAVGEDAVNVKSAIVDYKYKSTANPLTWRVFRPKIYLEFVAIESMEHNWRIQLCPHHSLPISSGEGLEFTEEACDYQKERRN
jgi:pancreatic triacylglycerol lipase